MNNLFIKLLYTFCTHNCVAVLNLRNNSFLLAWYSINELISPLPFCQAVYQDRLRNDVKKIIAVATVPFLSLISFQRLPVQLPLVLLVPACTRASGERTGADGGPDHLLSPPRSSSRSLLESRGSPAELMHFQREMCNPHACRHWKGSWIHFLNIQKGIEIDMKTYCFGFALFFWTALTTTIVKQIAD